MFRCFITHDNSEYKVVEPEKIIMYVGNTHADFCSSLLEKLVFILLQPGQLKSTEKEQCVNIEGVNDRWFEIS